LQFTLPVVHRIGRTGRSGRTGLATTFINKGNEESVLLDLKHLLIEAKQKVPNFLASMHSENEKYLDVGGQPIIFVVLAITTEVQRLTFSCWFADDKGCSYCGGLGHRITDCPKLEAIQNKTASNIGRRDYLADTTTDY